MPDRCRVRIVATGSICDATPAPYLAVLDCPNGCTPGWPTRLCDEHAAQARHRPPGCGECRRAGRGRVPVRLTTISRRYAKENTTDA